MKKILVATDFSAPASNAVEYAAHLAKASNAELTLFNVYKLSIHASNSIASTNSIDKLIKKNEKKLNLIADDLRIRFAIHVDWAMEKDDPVEALSKYTKSHPTDLVIMGIESNLTEYKLFGNTTTAVVQLMQFPLLVIPNDTQFEGLNKIMYACETSYLKEGCELGLLKNFVKLFDSTLEVFHVITDNTAANEKDELEQLMNKILFDVDHNFKYVHNLRVGDGISAGLAQSPADLLVMIPHKRGFFESIFVGSNTNKMTVKTRVPLLVIPNDKACG